MWHLGKTAWNKGLKLPSLSEEHKKKLSIAGKKYHIKQGIIPNQEYKEEFNNILKYKVRKRDNFRCQQCFRHEDELYFKGKKRKLSIHHVDYNKSNNDINNLISLCLCCHNQTNFGRIEWTKYFLDKTGAI